MQPSVAQAWMRLVGQAVGLGGFIFELGFDRQHPSFLPFCVALAAAASSGPSITRQLSSTLAGVRRLSLSARGLEVEMRDNPAPVPIGQAITPAIRTLELPPPAAPAIPASDDPTSPSPKEPPQRPSLGPSTPP